MSAREVPLSKSDRRKVAHFADDDGVRRFSVGQRRGLTYHEAYEAIIAETGSRRAKDGDKGLFTREGIRRLGLLNAAYLSAARPFLIAKALERKNQQAKAETNGTEQPPAAAPPGLPKPSLDPEQRKAWLKKHDAPADMMLVSIAEFARLSRGLITGNRQLRQAVEMLNSASAELDEYRSAPTPAIACANAVFDAKKFRRATEVIGIPAIQHALGTLEICIEAATKVDKGFALAADLVNERAALASALSVMSAIAEAKREEPKQEVKP